VRATTSYESLFKTILASQFGLKESLIEERIFPNSRKLNQLDGILAS